MAAVGNTSLGAGLQRCRGRSGVGPGHAQQHRTSWRSHLPDCQLDCQVLRQQAVRRYGAEDWRVPDQDVLSGNHHLECDVSDGHGSQSDCGAFGGRCRCAHHLGRVGACSDRSWPDQSRNGAVGPLQDLSAGHQGDPWCQADCQGPAAGNGKAEAERVDNARDVLSVAVSLDLRRPAGSRRYRYHRSFRWSSRLAPEWHADVGRRSPGNRGLEYARMDRDVGDDGGIISTNWGWCLGLPRRWAPALQGSVGCPPSWF